MISAIGDDTLAYYLREQGDHLVYFEFRNLKFIVSKFKDWSNVLEVKGLGTGSSVSVIDHSGIFDCGFVCVDSIVRHLTPELVHLSLNLKSPEV